MGGVGQAYSYLPFLSHRLAGPDARRRLDRARVDPTVHDPPGLVMFGREVDVPSDASARNLVQDEAGGVEEATVGARLMHGWVA